MAQNPGLRVKENEGRRAGRRGAARRGHEGGSDFRRWIERIARNLEDKFGARVELRDNGKIAVVARTGLRGEAKSDFGLNDDVDLVDEIGKGEKMMKNRRRDVVRKIAIDTDAPARSDRGEVRFENVAGDDVEIGELLCEVTQA